MPHRTVRSAVLALIVALTLAFPAMVLADNNNGQDGGKNEGFSAVADRASVVQGVSTSVLITVRPDDKIADHECYSILFPPAFTIQGATIESAPSRGGWVPAVQGGRVLLQSPGGKGEIKTGERLAVAITVRGTAPGAYSFSVGGYGSDGCGGVPDYQVTVSMAISPAPTPPPTPAPTSPAPVAPSSPSAAPRPSTAATVGAPGASTPASPAPNRRPESPSDVNPSPESQIGLDPSPAAVDPADPGGVPTNEPTGSTARRPTVGRIGPSAFEAETGVVAAAPPRREPVALSVAITDDEAHRGQIDTQLASSVLSAFAMLDNPWEWFVPGATVGVPGLLIVGILGAQLLGGAMWLPAVRRSLRDEHRRRRPLRPAWL